MMKIRCANKILFVLLITVVLNSFLQVKGLFSARKRDIKEESVGEEAQVDEDDGEIWYPVEGGDEDADPELEQSVEEDETFGTDLGPQSTVEQEETSEDEGTTQVPVESGAENIPVESEAQPQNPPQVNYNLQNQLLNDILESVKTICEKFALWNQHQKDAVSMDSKLTNELREETNTEKNNDETMQINSMAAELKQEQPTYDEDDDTSQEEHYSMNQEHGGRQINQNIQRIEKAKTKIDNIISNLKSHSHQHNQNGNSEAQINDILNELDNMNIAKISEEPNDNVRNKQEEIESVLNKVKSKQISSMISEAEDDNDEKAEVGPKHTISGITNKIKEKNKVSWNARSPSSEPLKKLHLDSMMHNLQKQNLDEHETNEDETERGLNQINDIINQLEKKKTDTIIKQIKLKTGINKEERKEIDNVIHELKDIAKEEHEFARTHTDSVHNQHSNNKLTEFNNIINEIGQIAKQEEEKLENMHNTNNVPGETHKEVDHLVNEGQSKNVNDSSLTSLKQGLDSTHSIDFDRILNDLNRESELERDLQLALDPEPEHRQQVKNGIMETETEHPNEEKMINNEEDANEKNAEDTLEVHPFMKKDKFNTADQKYLQFIRNRSRKLKSRKKHHVRY